MTQNVIERKQIGINLELSGTHNNTELIDGFIQLKPTLVNGVTTYPTSGFWISNVINIGDNFNEYDNLVSNIINDGDSKTKIFTRSSQNGISFGDWIEVGGSNEINSIKNQYIQIRIELTPGELNNAVNYDLSKFFSEYAEYSQNSVKLKKEFETEMLLDDSWTSNGFLYRKEVKRIEDWQRIDNINVSSEPLKTI